MSSDDILAQLNPPAPLKITVYVIVAPNGEYAAYGGKGMKEDDALEVLYDMMSVGEADSATYKLVHVVAEVPAPRTLMVTGKVKE